MFSFVRKFSLARPCFPSHFFPIYCSPLCGPGGILSFFLCCAPVVTADFSNMVLGLSRQRTVADEPFNPHKCLPAPVFYSVVVVIVLIDPSVCFSNAFHFFVVLADSPTILFFPVFFFLRALLFFFLQGTLELTIFLDPYQNRFNPLSLSLNSSLFLLTFSELLKLPFQ